jgi:ankyrin repeat protein
MNGNLTVAKTLIALGVDVNECDHDGKFTTNSGHTPLSAAVRNNQKQMVELLIKSGADPSAKESSGYDPIYLAKTNNLDDILSLLLKV